MNQTTAGLFTKNLYESNTQEEWDNFIGIFNYHYHFGFPGPSKNIFENTIYNYIFPYIANNSRVLDCGCGWGAPADMLQKQKKCKLTCITNNSNQFKFIKNNKKNLKVIQKDLNIFKPINRYDTALFVESFGHVTKQQELLNNISISIDNVLMIEHINNSDVSAFDTFWHHYANTLNELHLKFKNSGYKIQVSQILNPIHTVLTLLLWKKQLEKNLTNKGQLLLMEEFCNEVLKSENSLKQHNQDRKLILIYASKNL